MSPRRARAGGAIAIALHDVEPATFERCALIRDWLDDHGVNRATLLVIPAPDLHAFHDTRPELAAWLAERARAATRSPSRASITAACAVAAPRSSAA